MKKLAFIAVMLFAIINTKAQTGPSHPVRYNQTNFGWWDFQDDTYINDSLHLNKPIIQKHAIYRDSELAAAHVYTVTGLKPIVKITGTRLDTLKLISTKFKAGQSVWFLTTTTANDSTCFIPSAGVIQGGAYYWLTGATYKQATLYYDGYNWYIKP